MCVSSVLRPNNRSACSDQENSHIISSQGYGDGLAELVNCSAENTSQVVWVVSDVDAMNTVHSMEFNVPDDYDFSQLDPSKHPFPNEIWHVRDLSEIALLVACLAPIVILGIITNSMILAIIIRNKWLRSPSNYLIANLAATDLVILLTCPWMLIAHHSFQNYQLGAFGCRFEGFLQGFLLVTGVMNLTGISYDRLTAVVLPREVKLDHRGAICLILASWITGFCFALPLSIYREYMERHWNNFDEAYCRENQTFLPLYWHVLLFTLVWFPMVVMIICYTAIFRKLDVYERSLSRRWGAVGVRFRTRAARTAAMVLAAFAICRLPFSALVYVWKKMMKDTQINAVEGMFLVLWFISNYLIYFNCAINPFIYGFTNERFRKAMRSTPVVSWFMLSWCCIPFKFKSDKFDTASDKPPQEDKNMFKNIQMFPPKIWVFGAKEDGGEAERISGSTYDLKKQENANFIAVSSRMTPLTQEYI